MADRQHGDESGNARVDPTRGGSGRADGSLAGEPVNDTPTRDDIRKHLEDIVFPISTQDIIAHARERHAPLAVLDRLEVLPNRTFTSPTELAEALGTGTAR